MAADPRDAFLQAHTPTVMVPRFGALDPLAASGHRFLAAADGLWLELRRPWLYVREHVAYAGVAMPYGNVERVAMYAFGAPALQSVIDAFKLDALRATPNETAGCGVWIEADQRLEYRPLVLIDASPGRVEYHRPTLADGEHLAVDLHSHGELGAYFSATDDEDDAGEVKLAVVLGNLDDEITMALRLCVLGLFVENT